jgi:serine/threonine protein phosphatase PrpC
LSEATRLSYGLFYVMCSEPFTTIIESDVLVELSQRNIQILQRVINECRGDLLVGNSDWYLIDSSISEFTCREALKGLKHDVEEYRNK